MSDPRINAVWESLGAARDVHLLWKRSSIRGDGDTLPAERKTCSDDRASHAGGSDAGHVGFAGGFVCDGTDMSAGHFRKTTGDGQNSLVRSTGCDGDTSSRKPVPSPIFGGVVAVELDTMHKKRLFGKTRCSALAHDYVVEPSMRLFRKTQVRSHCGHDYVTEPKMRLFRKTRVSSDSGHDYVTEPRMRLLGKIRARSDCGNTEEGSTHREHGKRKTEKVVPLPCHAGHCSSARLTPCASWKSGSHKKASKKGKSRSGRGNWSIWRRATGKKSSGRRLTAQEQRERRGRLRGGK